MVSRNFQVGRAVWSTPLRRGAGRAWNDMVRLRFESLGKARRRRRRAGAESSKSSDGISLAKPGRQQAPGLEPAGFLAGGKGSAVVVAAHAVARLACRRDRLHDGV